MRSTHKAACATLGPPIARQRLTEHGDEIGGTVEELAARVRREHAGWGPLAQEAGIGAEWAGEAAAGVEAPAIRRHRRGEYRGRRRCSQAPGAEPAGSPLFAGSAWRLRRMGTGAAVMGLPSRMGRPRPYSGRSRPSRSAIAFSTAVSPLRHCQRVSKRTASAASRPVAALVAADAARLGPRNRC